MHNTQPNKAEDEEEIKALNDDLEQRLRKIDKKLKKCIELLDSTNPLKGKEHSNLEKIYSQLIEKKEAIVHSLY